MIIEREQSRVFSAHVAGLPVYVQRATRNGAEHALQRALAAYGKAHPEVTESQTTVKVAKIIRRTGGYVDVTLVGPGALVDRRTSKRKVGSSRRAAS